MTVLRTARLVLSELDASDAAFLVALLNDPGFLTRIGDRGVRTEADAQRYLDDGPRASYAANGFGLWRVADGATPVGICGLLRRPGLDHPDLGFALLQAHAGRGIATEAAAACLAYGHRDLGLPRIDAITSPGNAGSIHVLTKLGMRFAGLVTLPGIATQQRQYVSLAPADPPTVDVRS